MPNNGDIIKFIKQKDYIMVNNNLGSGSFGKTVLLQDPFIDELFVAKKYEPEYPEIKQGFFQSFLQEIKILYKLNHPNIVRIFNYYPYEDLCTGYILMEYVEGETIAEYFNSYLPWDNLVSLDNIFLQLIAGFQYMEKKSIVHRDIREGNILIDRFGTVKIIDFGLGKMFKPVNVTEDSMVEVINRSGLDRLPDEYFSGTYDTKTDMFYLAELFNRLLRKSANANIFSYQRILNRMMERNPDARFSSFEEISEVVGKTDFSTLEISAEDKEIYQNFSNAILYHLSAYTSEKQFNYNIKDFEKHLEEVIRKNCFETFLQNNNDLINTVVISAYRYIPTIEIRLDMVQDFYTWFNSLTMESQQLVLNNIIAKISSVSEDIDDGELPF